MNVSVKMIKTITSTSLYYDGEDNGIILDDAYDYIRKINTEIC